MAETRKKTDPRRELARRLFASGLEVERVAHAAGVSTRTIDRWKAADAETREDWDKLREGQGVDDIEALIALLKRRLLRLASSGGSADGIHKLHTVITELRQQHEDPLADMKALGRLLDFVYKSGIRQEEWAIFTKWTARWLDHLCEGGPQ